MRLSLGLVSLSLLAVACSTPPAAIPPAAYLPIAEGASVAHAEASSTPAAASATPPETFDVAALDAWVGKKVIEQHLVGLSLAIVRDGKTVLAKGYGLASREKAIRVEPTTAFGIGSVTKQLTCASVLLLEEQGKLSLNDKLAKYYPDLPRAKDISLADLGAHLSGYTDYYPLDFFDSRMAHGITPDALIQEYAKEPLDFAPRARWSYSNTGFVILGRVVEKVAKQPFGAFLNEHIFRPLGMDHASLSPPDSAPGLATGYESFALSEPRVAPREPESWLYAAGAVYASVTDLVKWDLALVDGKVLRPAAYAKMTTARTLTDKRGTAYGCGIGVKLVRGDTLLEHGGEVNGFLAQNGIVPRTRSAVVLLTNSQFGDPSGIYQTIMNLVLKDGATSVKPPTVRGKSIKDAALSMLHQIQAGHIDRTELGAEFSLFMNDAQLADAARRLGPLGEPSRTDVEGPFERGGMEVSKIHFTFATPDATKLEGLMYRTPDGRVQEFLVSKP